jgi:hypothetical protein
MADSMWHWWHRGFFVLTCPGNGMILHFCACEVLVHIHGGTNQKDTSLLMHTGGDPIRDRERLCGQSVMEAQAN